MDVGITSRVMWTAKHRSLLFLIAVIWMSLPRFAQEKTAMIVMNNGDRLGS